LSVVIHFLVGISNTVVSPELDIYCVRRNIDLGTCLLDEFSFVYSSMGNGEDERTVEWVSTKNKWVVVPPCQCCFWWSVTQIGWIIRVIVCVTLKSMTGAEHVLIIMRVEVGYTNTWERKIAQWEIHCKYEDEVGTIDLRPL
jgi:hypothetical protein